MQQFHKEVGLVSERALFSCKGTGQPHQSLAFSSISLR
nr:MAG TPA: hypothetical protein [Caudoviricetes sp.]